jgi:hypothetical protein
LRTAVWTGDARDTRPYAGLDERQRLRTKAVADGVWPPPNGPDQLLAQQADIYLPAEFSPLR